MLSSHLCQRFALIFCLAATSYAASSPPPVALKVFGLFDRLNAAKREKAAGKTPVHVNFGLTEQEINDYLGYRLGAAPRPGVDTVTLKVFPHNYVSTYTVVDFDAVEKWKPGTVPMLLKPVLNGKRAIWIDCRFHAADGKATFSVEKAYFGSIRLPAFFVQKMIEIVAARQPEKYDTSKPVPLPFGLRRVWTAGHAISGEN